MCYDKKKWRSIVKGDGKMLDYKLKIGLVPDVRNLGDFNTRKGIFEPAKGVENKEKVLRFLQENFADDKTEIWNG